MESCGKEDVLCPHRLVGNGDGWAAGKFGPFIGHTLLLLTLGRVCIVSEKGVIQITGQAK